MIGFDWYPYQWGQCSFGSAMTGSLMMRTKVQSLHHQICTSAIGAGIKWIVFLIWRCKDYIGSPLPSVSKYRVSPYFRTASPWPRTTPCTSVLIMGFDWYPYQCFRFGFGGARTGSFWPHEGAHIVLERCMHLQISLFTSSMYIRKHCPQFSWCEDWKTGWCTKAHANFFANSNNATWGKGQGAATSTQLGQQHGYHQICPENAENGMASVKGGEERLLKRILSL